jgi:uncharacterized protein (DUF849 family)
MLKAALNGSRDAHAHPALPITPDQLAADATACVAAGAAAIHMHPRDDDGREALTAEAIDRAVRAVRVRSV